MRRYLCTITLYTTFSDFGKNRTLLKFNVSKKCPHNPPGFYNRHFYEVCSESYGPDKITLQRYTLERWCKNIYFWDGFSMSETFWSRTAQISRLTSRASQSALGTATPSNPGYDGSTYFCRRARQGFQKSAGIKLLVDNMLGNKTLSIIYTNFIIIAVKDKKIPKWWKWPPTTWMPSPPLYTVVSLAVKQSMQLSSKRLWLRPSRFSYQKASYHRPRAGFCGWTKKLTPLAPNSGTFNGGEGIKTIRQPFYSRRPRNWNSV